MNDIYTTSDFPTVCYLIAHGMRLCRAQRHPAARRVDFVFVDAAQCEALAMELLLGDDQVSASRLLDASKRAKAIIHQGP